VRHRGHIDDLKGLMPVALVVLKSNVTAEREAIKKELIQLVRDLIGAVASFKEVYIVTKLPKIRSGKIL
jgi:propionyl-CoA synthetase